MTDAELLLEISNLFDIKSGDLKKELKEDISAMGRNIKQVETSLKAEIGQVKSELKSDIKELKITMECDVIPRLENLEVCYTDTFKRYAAAAVKFEGQSEDVDILKKVVAEHSQKLNQTA